MKVARKYEYGEFCSASHLGNLHRTEQGWGPAVVLHAPRGSLDNKTANINIVIMYNFYLFINKRMINFFQPR